MYVCTQTRLNDVGWMPATFMVLGCLGLLRPQQYAPRTNLQPVADAQEPVVVTVAVVVAAAAAAAEGVVVVAAMVVGSGQRRRRWVVLMAAAVPRNFERMHLIIGARTDFRNPSSVKRLWRRPEPGQNGVSSARGFRTGPSPHRPNATALGRFLGREARGVSLASVWIDTHS